MEKISVEQGISIAAPMDLVWEALTTAEQMKEWWGDAFEIDELKPGAAVHYGSENDRKSVTVKEAAPPHKFVILWGTPEWYSDVEVLTIFDLAKENGGTRIKVTETGFEGLSIDLRQRRIEGTSDTYQRMLGKLKQYAEYKATL